ncbi:hybrid sensor histidine kinase/response regulator [Desulfotignum balticum]|uniref:hybrid sensor histidine kinase/response regulator n=1 Tax=Desulfotignum balticum TaxID=115781 RepID=UPI000422267E|nr:hybrid sensor histidine kinase/response regulator [Desulfotignum balticum]
METLHLLVVDDEPALGAAVVRVLKEYTIHVPEVDLTVGYGIVYVDTGEKAMEILDDSAPDLLLLDHKLPGISGLDILNYLSDPSLDMLTIMITAYATLENAVAATRRGAYDFLAKPFTPEELKATIYRATKHLLLCRQSEKLAREKRRIRFEFISVLAHELKAPLAAIQQYLDIVRTADPAVDAGLIRQLADRSLERVKGMRKLILDLLDVTRLESGQKPRQMIWVDLLKTAALAVENMTGPAEERGITMEICSDGPICVFADPWEMETILNNLVSNAVKYNVDNGRVTVTLSVTQHFVSIQVSDTGIGISSQDADRLFKEFVRIRTPHTDRIAGSGLGLSIIKKIAALYNGDITLESIPGSGSCFTVTLNTPMGNIPPD